MSEYQEMLVTCVEKDCRKQFEVTAGEQEFFAQKGFALPKRCKECRNRRKREDNSAFGGVARQMRGGYGKR